MKTFIACLVIVAAASMYKKIHTCGNKKNKTAPEKHLISFNEIELLIDELSELKEQLNEIENMITDIESCNPDERATTFKIIMPSNCRSIELLANNHSEYVLKLLYSERNKCRSSIVKTVQNLAYRCNGNVTETMYNNAAGGVVCDE